MTALLTLAGHLAAYGYGIAGLCCVLFAAVHRDWTPSARCLCLVTGIATVAVAVYGWHGASHPWHWRLY